MEIFDHVAREYTTISMRGRLEIRDYYSGEDVYRGRGRQQRNARQKGAKPPNSHGQIQALFE